MSFSTKMYTRPVLIAELKKLPPSAFESFRTLAVALSPRAGLKSAKVNALRNQSNTALSGVLNSFDNVKAKRIVINSLKD